MLFLADFFAVFVIVVDVLFVVLDFDVIAKRRDVQRVFVSRVGFGFGDGLRRAGDFLDGGFVRFFVFVVVVFLGFVEFLFVRLFFGFVLFEDSAASGCFGFDDFANFILLGVDQAGRKRVAFIVAELRTVFAFFGGSLRLFEGVEFFLIEIRLFRFEGFRLFARYFRGVRSTGEKPTGQRTTGTARSRSAGRQ